VLAQVGAVNAAGRITPTSAGLATAVSPERDPDREFRGYRAEGRGGRSNVRRWVNGLLLSRCRQRAKHPKKLAAGASLADPRQLLAREPVYDPLTAEAGLHLDEVMGILRRLPNDGGLGTEGMGAHGPQ
jgi:hypothetical protein